MPIGTMSDGVGDDDVNDDDRDRDSDRGDEYFCDKQ